MENIHGLGKVSGQVSATTHGDSLQPTISYMLLCELLKMDLYNHSDPDPLSVLDIMDDRNDLDSLFMNSDRQDCVLDPKLEPGLPDLEAMDTGVSNSDAFGDVDWLQGLQHAAITQLHQLSEAENTDPNLLVNPQTVIPVNMVPNLHTQVRDAMLTQNLNSINVIVSSAPSLVSESLRSPNIAVASDNGYALTGQSLNKNLMSPSESSPVLVGHLQNLIRPVGRSHITVNLSAPGIGISSPSKKDITDKMGEKPFPKPVFSYSCLIALALKNSPNGSLPVSEIYNFMTENFPYFKTAPDGWKNSVRHNLSLNKCFEKVENPKLSSNAKKGCLWALNPAKKEKMEEEIAKGSKKDPAALRCSMAFPDNLEKIERGEAGLHTEKQTHVQALEPMSPCKPIEQMPTPIPQTPVTTKPDDLFATELRDINVLDSNFALEPSLSELAMQVNYHGLWDDDLSNDLNLSPHIMATVGSPLVTASSTSSSDVNTGVLGPTYHGTCVYSSSPIADLHSNQQSAFTATLLSLTSPNRNVSVAKT